MVNSVPARALGAPHERERVFIVAHAQGEPEREQADQTDTKPIGRLSWMEPSGIPEHLRAPAAHVAHASGQQMGPARQPRVDRSLEKEWPDPNAEGIRRGQGRTRRPPDSFARIRDEARRNAADPYGARLAFREGIPRDAWEKLTPAEREAFGNERQSIWPDEPALQRVDDVTPHWMDRVRETGNTIVRLIPQLIGEAILAARRENRGKPVNPKLTPKTPLEYSGVQA